MHRSPNLNATAVKTSSLVDMSVTELHSRPTEQVCTPVTDSASTSTVVINNGKNGTFAQLECSSNTAAAASLSATDQWSKNFSSRQYYDPSLALSLCQCAKQQQHQQQQQQQQQPQQRPQTGNSRRSYPFFFQTSLVSPNPTVTYLQLAAALLPTTTTVNCESLNHCSTNTTCELPLLSAERAAAAAAGTPTHRPQPLLFSSSTSFSSFSQSQPQQQQQQLLADAHSVSKAQYSRAKSGSEKRNVHCHLPQSGHSSHFHSRLLQQQYSPQCAAAQGTAAVVGEECRRASQLFSSSSFFPVSFRAGVLPLLALLWLAPLVAAVYGRLFPFIFSLTFLLLFLLCHSAALPSLLLSLAPFLLLPSTWTVFWQEVRRRWWWWWSSTKCWSRQLLERTPASALHCTQLYGQPNNCSSSSHFSPVQCSAAHCKCSSQKSVAEPKSAPTESFSLPLLIARAISHFCTSVTRHSSIAFFFFLASCYQNTCQYLLSYFSLFATSSTSSLCHSLLRSEHKLCAENPVASKTESPINRSKMRPLSSARSKQSQGFLNTQPCYLWYILILALLALSEPLLVSGSSPLFSSSSSSAASIYSSGSSSHLVAPVVYGLSSNRRQPKRNLHVGGSGRSPAKPNFTYFEEKDSSVRFSHMCVNVFNGRIYVGGDNGIYQLKMNGTQLVLEEKAVMGPAEDNPDCPANKNCPPHVTKRLSNYYNKALVIDMQHSWLISCGSLYQGACAAHNWNNVSQVLHAPMESVVANNATASTVVFIAPGPPPHKTVLYVGATFTIGNYRSDVPAVSSRSLFENHLFQLASTDVSSGTRLVVNSLLRERYPINYIYGFQARGFSYFLTVQKTAAEGSKPYQSKLVRLCQKDPDYYSYTEVPLVCRTTHVKYNLAQAAYVGKPGAELAKSMGITTEDDLLFVVFAKSREELEDARPSSQSALCVYSLLNIHKLFTQNIQHCFNGNGDHGLDFINIKQKCVSTQVQINEDFCGMDVNQPLGGINPIETEPAITYDNVLLTSVAAAPTHEYTVGFLGTSTGHLKKVSIEASKYDSYEFSDIVVQEGSAVNADMHVNVYDRFVYVMTTRRVTMVKVAECHAYRTCMDCLGARNPYCGWCSLENKCSLKTACAEAQTDPLYWLSYKSGKCTTITNVNPPQIQRTTIRTLNLIIDNLPVLDGRLLCVFTTHGKVQVTNASRSNNGVSCPTPPTDTLPAIPDGHHAFTSKLSVRMKDGPDFVATNFTFYDCASYTSCTKCVSSLFPCDWCVGGHRCTHDTGENCRNEILVTGIKSVGPSIRSGPSFCPRINSTTGGSTEVLVSSGSSAVISVRVFNIPQAVSIHFVCQFNIEGRVSQVNANLLTDTIYCKEKNFSYVTNQTSITVPLAVIWDVNKPLDNTDNIHVRVYRCAGLANNCGACLELDERYNCGWCQQRNRLTNEVHESCEVAGQCVSPGSNWLNRQQICPNPRILDFYPRSGPLEGGTNLTIEGINLGRTFEDIEKGVGIAHELNGKHVNTIPCYPFPEEYVKTTRIKCRIQSPRNVSLSTHQFGSLVGPVEVRVQTEFTARSRDVYTFVNPKILTINPSKGPISGGTLLSIEGLNMNAGSKAEAFLGSLPCNVTKRTLNHAECITSARETPGDEQLIIMFDSGQRTFDYYKFLYVKDPVVSAVESGPTGIWKSIARGIPNGGILITVRGENLHIIQRPQMYVEVEGEIYVSNCTATVTGTEMRCESPYVSVDQLDFAWTDKDYIELDYGFIMDGVAKVRNLSTRTERPFPKFRMYRNPEFQLFADPQQIKYYRSEYLTINARHMEGITSEDLNVWIGNELCNITALSPIQLTCRLPAERPMAEEENYSGLTWDRLPAVIVGVGKRMNITLGLLSYDESSGISIWNIPTTEVYKHVFIVIVVGICILFVVVVVILILYRRKSTESSRVLKTMQEQMDVLELRVASEAKEAFAELQTEITDITAEINVGGIPFLDYRLYTLKVLFPNAEDHAVLQDLALEPSERQQVEKALQLFGQLIMNKTFLLLFIRTLESNRYFSMRDRVNVASLIMVTLQGKMEYCTGILKTLLAELIEKCMEGKSHPKLLLRRTESVAEKMLSSWFTFLLYKFLKECAGDPLYLLYFAIKHQVEKGPVDEITSEARYSLSEEKLIRQQIDYKPLTINVAIPNAFGPSLYGVVPTYDNPHQIYGGSPQTLALYGQAPVYSSLPTSEYFEAQVKVLDCDTIAQVKEKCLDVIYRGVPFSQRPFREDELDLEWRTGTTGKLTLQNEDQTCRTAGEWRRTNTLAHYKVPDNAQFILNPNAKLYNSIDYMTIGGGGGHHLESKMAGTLGGGSSSSSSGFAEKHRYEPLHHFKGLTTSNSPPSSLSRPTSPPSTHPLYNHHHPTGGGGRDHHERSTTAAHHEHENGGYHHRMWHLVKHHDNDHGGKENDRGSKMVSEIYLTRLLATKGTLQKYVDDLFETIFSTRDVNRGSSLPLAIKYMFDFLDDQATHHGIHDSEVVHTWKSNSLPLRFWVNLIKNPNFVFDINKSNTVDSCLSVVAQTFMDACSTSDHRLGKDSPSSKLLYAKDIPIYKEWVERYYKEIETMPSISDQDMNAMLAEESRQHAHEFNTNVALHELYKYAHKYKDQLLQTLNEDEFSVKNSLQQKLERVYETMSGKTYEAL